MGCGRRRDDVPAKPVGKPYGITIRPGSVRQQVVEQPPIDKIVLHADAEMLGRIPVNSAAETIKTAPVDFVSRRNKLCHDSRCYRIGGMRRDLLPDRSQRRPYEQRNGLEMAKLHLRSRRDGLREGVS